MQSPTSYDVGRPSWPVALRLVEDAELGVRREPCILLGTWCLRNAPPIFCRCRPAAALIAARDACRHDRDHGLGGQRCQPPEQTAHECGLVSASDGVAQIHLTRAVGADAIAHGGWSRRWWRTGQRPSTVRRRATDASLGVAYPIARTRLHGRVAVAPTYAHSARVRCPLCL